MILRKKTLKRRLNLFLFFLFLLAHVTFYSCSHYIIKHGEEQHDIKYMTAFFGYPGTPMSPDNRIKEKITKKCHTKINISWLGDSLLEDATKRMISAKNYPDFIDGSDSNSDFIEAGAFIALDEYIDQYPNLKNYLTDVEWDQIKSTDGHIYVIPQFDVIYGKGSETNFRGEAFYIQKAVLEWAGYPVITKLSDYFDLLSRYKERYPKIEGHDTIGFQILCDDWRSFCLWNPPQLLSGYPDDVTANVDPKTLNVSLYDFIPEAKVYYQTLNIVYEQGLIQPSTFVMSYREYLDLLSTGSVLGMVDYYWQFEEAQKSLYEKELIERTYVPLELSIDGVRHGNYQNKKEIYTANGIGISVKCKDVDAALSFMNNLLDPEIMKLRFWGEEGIDYMVNEDGSFYRTEEQRKNSFNSKYQYENVCTYKYFPHYEGYLVDEINTVNPQEQPSEFKESLNDYDKKVLNAYGVETWFGFLTEQKNKDQPWYPLYGFTKKISRNSKAGCIADDLIKLRTKWLPTIIMSNHKQFEELWSQYKNEYDEKIDVEYYESLLTNEVKRRCANGKRNKQMMSK